MMWNPLWYSSSQCNLACSCSSRGRKGCLHWRSWHCPGSLASQHYYLSWRLQHLLISSPPHFALRPLTRFRHRLYPWASCEKGFAESWVVDSAQALSCRWLNLSHPDLSRLEKWTHLRWLVCEVHRAWGPWTALYRRASRKVGLQATRYQQNSPRSPHQWLFQGQGRRECRTTL